ncbi:hypothetical protein N7541_009100 [Penicillium brevicompactum]|uniref:Methyltransferase domain-containing protein n=1 Tax=Penicillium brevicompactum TaxID=5074 RepID=A0A9W9QY85_PENBR|nr:hypothetical protein N7541_009100 [Penicillium brevicompactum]
MIPNRPLPISGAWETPDAYTEALLSFATTSVLFMNLCGGVHMVDFLTREPDVYTTTLPEEWREFFQHYDVQDIIHLLLREEIGPLRAATQPVEESGCTWRGGAFPPQSLLDYIFNVRQLALLRDLDTSPASQTELPSQVVMRMNRKKVHEVRHFSQYVASLSQTVYERRGEPVSHIVDFGSGQNYLGRTLVSPLTTSISSRLSGSMSISAALERWTFERSWQRTPKLMTDKSRKTHVIAKTIHQS